MKRPRAPWRGCDIKASTRPLGSCSQTVISLGHSRLFGDNRPQTGLYPRCREGRADDVLSSAFVAAMHLPIRFILRETENDMSYGSGAEARL